MLFNVLVLKNLHNCALTPNGLTGFQSILRCSSPVMILNLTRIKFSISLLDQLIHFLLTKDICKQLLDLVQEDPMASEETGGRNNQTLALELVIFGVCHLVVVLFCTFSVLRLCPLKNKIK